MAASPADRDARIYPAEDAMGPGPSARAGLPPQNRGSDPRTHTEAEANISCPGCGGAFVPTATPRTFRCTDCGHLQRQIPRWLGEIEDLVSSEVGA